MKHIIITDLGFGDSGKGQITAALSERLQPDFVIRSTGGPQAAHNVRTPEGIHHTHAQTGSGTLLGVPTILTGDMIVALDRLLVEIRILRSKLSVIPTIYVDMDCPLIVPSHTLANRMRETVRRDDRHGSCGVGLGEARRLVRMAPACIPRVRDLMDINTLKAKADWVSSVVGRDLPGFIGMTPSMWASYVKLSLEALECCTLVFDHHIQNMVRNAELVLWEGAQGVLLDETHGFNPHTTWSTVTDAVPRWCIDRWDPGSEIYSLGVTRTFLTRHGPGPMPTESEALRPLVPAGEDNEFGKWQGAFRLGWADIPLLTYAANCMWRPVDGLAVTHADLEEKGGWSVAHSYRGQEERTLFSAIGEPWTAAQTVRLGRAEPLYTEVAAADIPAALASALDIPLAVVSRGNKTHDAEIICGLLRGAADRSSTDIGERGSGEGAVPACDGGPGPGLLQLNECPRCHVALQEGMAIVPSLVPSELADFPGDQGRERGVTMNFGPGYLRACHKCPKCGFSRTRRMVGPEGLEPSPPESQPGALAS